jgi:alpha-N-arabinofuranosidase
MKTTLTQLLVVTVFATLSYGTEFHVEPNGDDGNRGTKGGPLRTIQRAAELAEAGDVITVHGGVYRERINPPRGGKSDSKRIVYQAARGERVEIKGSEVVKSWVRVQGEVWKVTLPNSFFGGFNPYSDVIHGDWFNGKGRVHHTGAVYVNGEWLVEGGEVEEVMGPVGKTGLWFAQLEAERTTIWAQFPGVNPNEELVEINVRRTVFYPEQPGRNYITVRGFWLSQAATPWAPPTAEQVGLIGTQWSKGWIIESNVISHSVCSGIALGKHGDEWDNTSADTAEGYVKTIERGLAKGWNRETIGHHVVRNNTISDCEQTGIVGSLGAAFSTVAGNVIHDIHVRQLFTGAEMAGIKFHAAIDTVIRDNHIYRTCRGLWLDWMAQGTRVSGNLFHDNLSEDIFVEVDHGPFVVDNNVMLSGTSLLDMSEGGAYVNNLMTGRISTSPEPRRETPYHPAHGTSVAGLKRIEGGDDRFYNNVFVGKGVTAPGPKRANPGDSYWEAGYGLWVYDGRGYPLQTGGNVFLNGARPYVHEVEPVVAGEFDPQVKLVEGGGEFRLELDLGSAAREAKTRLVTTEMLGKARVPGVGYERGDGSALRVDRDYFGKKRSAKNPTAGPFEEIGTGRVSLRVW